MNLRQIKTFVFRAIRKTTFPLIPGRDKLPFKYWLQRMEGTIEKELLFLHCIVPNGQVAIDVGASEGLYSCNMSKLFSKVYAFEINTSVTQDLKAFNPGNIEIIDKGLSSREGEAVLYIPVLNGHPLNGWASLTPNNSPDTREHIEKKVTVCSLDSFAIEQVALIKIDVEGHEVEVLRGGANTLRRSRPAVIVEVKRHNLDEVFAFFAGINYEHRELRSFVNATGYEENYIFVPKDQTGDH